MKKILTIAAILLAAAVSASAQSGTWSGKLEVQGMELPIVFHLEDENPTADSPDQGARGIPIEVDRKATGAIVIRIPSLGAVFEGQWVLRQIVGTFTQMGVSLPLTLVPGELKRNRPQTPQGPFPYGQEEVTFKNGGATLKGTLTLPSDFTRETPALVMVTGSGQQNRDEEIFGHKPFAVIADALARAGIATLRYDDRGFGESTGDLSSATTEDLKDDALAGVDLLRGRFDRVGVIGHSEGGTIALMIAAEGKADFVVSLAGAVVSGAETLLWQNRLALSAAGLPDETVETYCSLLSEAFEAVRAGLPMPSAANKDLPDGLKQNYLQVVQQLRIPYMQYFISLDMRPLLGGIGCPVLALNGSKDHQVEPVSNLGALKDGLPSNPATLVEEIEGLNHLFQHCKSGEVVEYKEIEETFSPEVLDLMARWIGGL